MATPTDEDINNFLTITACGDKQLAIRFLQGANNDISQAVNNYFENPTRYANVGYSELTWEYVDFLTSNRNPTMRPPSPATDTGTSSTWTPSQVGELYGDSEWDALMILANMRRGVAFQIHAPDEPAQSYSHSSAPTRPPSRASHHGMSSSVEVQQESGVVGGSGAYFGPATQESYDPSKWALTRAGVTETEVYPDLSLPFQPRVEGEPTLVKPIPEVAELASLLTILTTIPLALEMLLSLPADRNSSQEFYTNPSVKDSTKPYSGDLEQSSGESMAADDPMLQVQLVRLVQRLAAFMIFTNRSYIDMETLLQSRSYSDDRLPAIWFLEAWSEAIAQVTGRDEAGKLFLVRGIEGELDNKDDWHEVTFHILNLYVPEMDGDLKATLYDTLDEAVWATNKDGSLPGDIWLHDIPNVLIFRTHQSNSNFDGLNMKVPSTFFIDRYMYKNVRELRTARQNRKVLLDQIELAKKKIERLSTFNPVVNGKQVSTTNDSQVLIKETIATLKRTQDDNDLDEAEAVLIKRLELLSTQIEIKVKEHKSHIENLKKTIQERNDHFKSANSYGPLNPSKLYTLRGVTAKPGVTYVRYPYSENPEQLDWWRLEYTSAPEIVKAKVMEKEVLHSAATSSREVLLVYATDEACKPIPALGDWNYLTPHLQAEIDAQNKALDAEIKSYNEGGMDWANSTVINSVEDDPPPYNADDSQESLAWCPDPGPSVVSDREFAEDGQAWRAREREVKAGNDGKTSRTDVLIGNESERAAVGQQRQGSLNHTHAIDLEMGVGRTTGTAELNAASRHESEMRHIEDARMSGTGESQGQYAESSGSSA